MGQESLFNVMKAYSLHDREVGYCQGTAFIVGLLLMQVSWGHPGVTRGSPGGGASWEQLLG